jgi:hypothetical protein
VKSLNRRAATSENVNLSGMCRRQRTGENHLDREADHDEEPVELVRSVPTAVKVLLSAGPRLATAAITAVAIKPHSSAYSTAVGPSSLVKKR